MSRTLKSVLAVLCIAGSTSSFSQKSLDTIALVQEYAYQKNFKKASSLLSAYQQRNPNQYTFQLHAQVCYWMKDYEKALALYKEGIQKFPAYTALQLDFGRTLFQLGKLKEAEAQLKKYTLADTQNVEANLYLSQLALWKGNVREARKKLTPLYQAYPNNASIKELSEQISSQYNPFVEGGFEYLSDDQPINATQYSFKTGSFESALFSPYFSGTAAQFATPGNQQSTFWIRAGNTFRLGYGNTALQVEGGIFQGSKEYQSFTGALNLTQKLSPSMSLLVSAAKAPYQYTVASLLQPFTNNTVGAALQLNKKEKFLGKAGLEQQLFQDGNNITTAYGWLLFPLVHQKSFFVKGGYGINYAHAASNNFTNGEPVNKLAAEYGLYKKVPGKYVPYFTPQHQLVHSVMATAQMQLSRSVLLNGRGSYGVMATADNPVLMLEQNRTSQLHLKKYYYQYQYNPIEMEGALQLTLSPKLLLHLKYTYSSLLFYTRSHASVQANYRFSYGKKK